MLHASLDKHTLSLHSTDVSLSSAWVRSFPSRVRFQDLGVRSFPSLVHFQWLEVPPQSPVAPLVKQQLLLQAHLRGTLHDPQKRASVASNHSQSVKPHPAVSLDLNEGCRTLLNSIPPVNPPHSSSIPLLVFDGLSYARLSYDPTIPHTSH